MKAWWPFLLILVVYMLLLGAVLSWHSAYGDRPIHHSDGSKLLVFAMSTALVGLFSLGGALATLRYATGMALVVVSGAILMKLWMVFEERHIAWELIAVFSVQLIILVIALSAFCWRGLIISNSHSTNGRQGLGTRFAIRDLLVVTAALAVLFAVLSSSEPSFSTFGMVFVLSSAGASAALVTAAAVWLCLGTSTFWLRVAVCLAVAPTGGLLYLIALVTLGSVGRDWQWFAGITVTQMILMIFPLTVMRMRGFRYHRVGNVAPR